MVAATAEFRGTISAGPPTLSSPPSQRGGSRDRRGESRAVTPPRHVTADTGRLCVAGHGDVTDGAGPGAEETERGLLR